MASITMAASSFLSSTALTSRGSVYGRHGLVVANAARGGEVEEREEVKNGRRDLVFAAAAAAVCSSVAGIAVAVEPKRGSAEARKVYAPVCITNPTAKICHR